MEMERQGILNGMVGIVPEFNVIYGFSTMSDLSSCYWKQKFVYGGHTVARINGPKFLEFSTDTTCSHSYFLS